MHQFMAANQGFSGQLQVMILDILEKSKKSKTLVGINTYNSGSAFYCGYVLDFSEEFVIVQHFSKFGIPDGLLVQKMADIQYIETDSQYLNGLELAINHRNAMTEQTFQLKNKGEYSDHFHSLFERFIGKRDYLIKFDLTDDETYFGFIEWCDEHFFSIVNIDSDGLVIGKATFRYDDLKLYWIDDLDCRKRQLLYNARNVTLPGKAS